MRLNDGLRNPLFLNAARTYAERGWPIFPVHWAGDGQCSCGKSDCRSPGKHPLTPNGHKEATRDEGKILGMVRAMAQGQYRHGDGYDRKRPSGD